MSWVDGAMSFFRDQETLLMERASGTLRRPGPGALNSQTATWTPSTTVVYSGPGYIRPAGREGLDAVTGDDNVRVDRYTLKLPVDTAARKGDIWTQDTSTGDGGLVGRSFRITDVTADEAEITRVCAAEEVTT